MDLTQQTLSRLTVEPSLETVLAPLVERRQQLKAQIAKLEAECDDVNDAIKTALVNGEQFAVVVDGHKLTLDMEAEKSTLDKKLLLQNGVSTEQIQRATKVTTYIKLDVRRVKESE